MAERLRALFGGGPAPRAFVPRPKGRFGFDPGPRIGLAGTPLPPLRGGRAREPQREIFILAGLLNHPRLIDLWAEDIAALEFVAPLAMFRSRLLDVALIAEPESLGQALDAAGLGEDRRRLTEAARRMPSGWCIGPEAPPADVETALRQSMALQRKSGALHKELKSAALALETDPSEQNLARLLDIKASLADLNDAEAAVEGFGLASGRIAPPV
jgi:DNA primase